MNDFISVIVPVYNVAAYLPSCIDSILFQDYSSLEVILIDDGSTDESGEICDEYAQKDRRIKVIHQTNGGAAAAKNAGLRIASGEFLSFVDSDDFLEPGAYSHMIQVMQEQSADVVQCSYQDIFKDHMEEHVLKKVTLNQIDFLVLFTEDWTCALLWDKLYKRSLYEEIFFETGHKIDDEYFTYRGILNAKKIVRDSQIVYNYRKRASSVMYSPTSARQIISDRIDYLSKRRKNVIACFPQLRAVYDNHFLNMMIILSRDENATEENLKSIRLYLKEYFYEKPHTKPDYRLIPSLSKLMFWGSKKNLRRKRMAQPLNNLDSFFE
ncbi:glycosyltransferase family 2 protein [Fusibacillus kribbianus]|uniref:Glycosyltransferase n=1 Tax=Fusibacillus kribbianus TaxID=3044208 RepID=A0AAP4B9W5_9FIRM|nr:glycosyltransferase [Ruminococcus sp. YH-rum2234]MDI9241552.1 glycosyltransferase [Ruminococcus sp. YH-rum2234]